VNTIPENVKIVRMKQWCGEAREFKYKILR
jgi:hypothetical protein